MSQYIEEIMTKEGAKQINYDALANKPIQRIVSENTERLGILRNMDSGVYVLSGRFRLYAGASEVAVFTDNMLVNIVRQDDKSAVQVFSPENNAVQHFVITDNDYTLNTTRMGDMDKIAMEVVKNAEAAAAGINAHPPTPGPNGTWLVWDATEKSYKESDIALPEGNSVWYTEQNLSEEQKKQTRKNIGAAEAVYATPQMYGAKGDGVTDDTAAFTSAANSGKNVFIPAGTYKLTDFSVNTKCIITGENKNTTHLFCNGITLNAEMELSNLHIGNYDTTKTALLVNKSGCYVHDCLIYGGNIGLELSSEKHIISGVFRNLTIAECKHAGVKAIASGNAQKNQILYEHLYIVNTGENTQDKSAPSTELENGFGMYVDGGYGIEIRNCVFEYNSGVGLYLGMMYPLWGCNVTSPYFEYNKYAQLYVNNADGTYMKNVHISGEFYSDAGGNLPDNALKTRGLYVKKTGGLKNNETEQGNYFSDFSAKSVNFANRFCPNNLFPYDIIGEMQNDQIAFADFNGERVWQIAPGYHSMYGVPIYVEKGSYTISFDAAASEGDYIWLRLYLNGHSDGNKQMFANVRDLATGEWRTFTFNFDFSQQGNLLIQAYNDDSNAKMYYVKNIRIVKAAETESLGVDSTLSVSGQAADAKVVGEAIAALRNNNRYCPNNLFPYDIIGEMQNDQIAFADFNGERVWQLAPGYHSMYGAPICVEKGSYTISFDAAASEGDYIWLRLYLNGHSDGNKSMLANVRGVAAGEWRTFTFNFDFSQQGQLLIQGYNDDSNANLMYYVKNIRIVKDAETESLGVDSTLSVSGQAADAKVVGEAIAALRNNNRFCPNNLFPYDVIGEAEGSSIIAKDGLTLGDYNGEKVWKVSPGGLTVTAPDARIHVESGEYLFEYEVAADEGHSGVFIFGLTGMESTNGSTTSVYPATEWVKKSRKIGYSSRGRCTLYVSNASPDCAVYIRNIRIVRVYNTETGE